MATISYHYLFSCILLLLHTTHADDHHHPAAMDFLEPLVGTQEGDSAHGLSKLKRHLSNLGYLSQPPPHDDLFDDNLRQAITNYQAYFKLPSTATLDAATLAHLRRPRCGVRDFFPNTSAHYTFFPGAPKWPAGKRYLTYSFPPGTRKDAYKAIEEATRIWAGVSPFRFRYISKYNAADVKISFQVREHGDGAPFDGEGGVLAHAVAPPGGMLHFDGEERWVDGVGGGEFDLQTVGLHELGHILGLGHSPDGAAIMFPYINIASRKGLGKDDVDGITALYSTT